MDRALPYLKRAEDSGQRSPELAYALGRCYGYVYQRQVDQARSIEDVEERSARMHDFEQKWKRPALEYFLQSKGASAEPQEYLEALVENFWGKPGGCPGEGGCGSRPEPAVVRVMAPAGADSPDAGTTSRGWTGCQGPASEGFASYDAARIIAPSDTDLWLEDAKVHRELTRQAGDFREGSVQVAACREAAGHFLEIRPAISRRASRWPGRSPFRPTAIRFRS